MSTRLYIETTPEGHVAFLQTVYPEANITMETWKKAEQFEAIEKAVLWSMSPDEAIEAIRTKAFDLGLALPEGWKHNILTDGAAFALYGMKQNDPAVALVADYNTFGLRGLSRPAYDYVKARGFDPIAGSTTIREDIKILIEANLCGANLPDTLLDLIKAAQWN